MKRRSFLFTALAASASVSFNVQALDAVSAVAGATANLEVARSSSSIAASTEATLDAHGEVAVAETKQQQWADDAAQNATTAHLTSTGSPRFENCSDDIVLESPKNTFVQRDNKQTANVEEYENATQLWDIQEEDDDDDSPENWFFVEEGEAEDHENFDYYWIDMETGKLFEDTDKNDLPSKSSEIPKNQPSISPHILKALLEQSQAKEFVGSDLWHYEFAEEDEQEHSDWDYFWVDMDTGEILDDKEVDEEEEEEEEDSEWEYVDEDEIEDLEYDYFHGEDENPVGAGTAFGVPQIVSSSMIEGDDADLFNDTAVQESLQKTEHYMKEIVWKQDAYAKVRDLCFNYYPLCEAWASYGECDANEKFMKIECAPSCHSCEALHYETRCQADPSTDIFQASGDIQNLFERITANDNYQHQVLSQPQELADAPWLITIDDFFTEEEAQHIVSMGIDQGFERSTISGGVDEETGEPEDNIEDEAITSSSTWCVDECDEDEIVESIFRRIEELTGVPPEHAEHLQIVKYEEGEFYLSHLDYVAYEQTHMAGPRVLTILMYFNEVEEGGETYFNKLDLKIKPKMGRIAIWANVKDESPDQLDERMEHQALPVLNGTKYVANSWFHLRSVQDAIETGCI